MNELQVIILAAGKGSRLREMTTNRPKCLLPIGLYPMVYYPMKMFERFGFNELYLIVSETDKNEVETALERTDLAIKFNSITVPCDAEDRGTAYSLRFIAPYITSDFIVVSCDLISDVDINSILNFHRKNDASLTVLYFHAPSAVTDLIVPGSKTGNKTERDLVGIDPATNRLVFSASASDYVKNLRMKRGLLYKHGRVRMHTALLDAHFYVMKRWLIRYLVNNERFATVKGELLPYAVQQQISSKNKLRLSRDEPSRTDISLEVSPVKVDREKSDSDIFSMAENFGCDSTAQTMSSFNDHSGDLSKVYLKDNIRCYAYIVPDEFGLRCNSMREFCRANKLMIEKWKDFANSETSNISSESKVESNQVESCSCFVGAKTIIESKTSISKTTLGSGCHVQQKTKIIDCVIMNDVKIGEGCNLSNCIICDDVVISANCSLKDCFIGNRHSVPANSSMKIHQVRWTSENKNYLYFNELSCFQCRTECSHGYHVTLVKYNDSDENVEDTPECNEEAGQEEIPPEKLTNVKLGDWLIARFKYERSKGEGKWIGRVDRVNENDTFLVSFLRPKLSTKYHDGYLYCFPNIPDEVTIYKTHQIVRSISAPTIFQRLFKFPIHVDSLK